MASDRSTQRLRRFAEAERERDAELYEQLRSGSRLSKRDILGREPARASGVYPAGLIVEDFLSLSLALNETVIVNLPALFTVNDFEETLGIPFGSFLELIDRGNIIPILGDYESYSDPLLVAPIVNEARPHYTEQRVALSLLSDNGLDWSSVVEGLERAMEIFQENAMATLNFEDLGAEVHIQGVHVAYAKLWALGYGPAIDDVVRRYQSDPSHELFDAFRYIATDGELTTDLVLFALTTYLSDFFSNCVSLGAMGQFDSSYESILRVPEVLVDSVEFLPVAFGRRLVQWLDIDIPKRIEHADLDWLINSDVRQAIASSVSQFKAQVEGTDYVTAADTGLKIGAELHELDLAYRRLTSLKKFGSFASKVSFAAVPITGSAVAGLLGNGTEFLATLGLSGVGSAAAKVALAQIEGDDILAKRVFNPLLARVTPWRMDAVTYQLCEVKARTSSGT
jgi:hypothetical protein